MTFRRFLRPRLILLFIFFLAQACSPAATAPITPFRPPSAAPPTPLPPTATLIPPAPTASAVPTSTAEVGVCENGLTFLDDLTVEDNSVFSPNEFIDKRWLVRNSGTCNWDSSYKLKWVGGDLLGAAEEQPLYPAKADVQATLQIIFSAPAEAGTYQSVWQAADVDGVPFGDKVYMEIIVEE